MASLQISITNTSRDRVAHRRGIEYPGFLLNSFLEPGECAAVDDEPTVVRYFHSDGHSYNIYFYRLSTEVGFKYVADFNPESPSERTLVCNGRYNEGPTTTVLNISGYPFAFRADPEYPGMKLSGFLDKGEAATVDSEFRLIPHIHSDEHVYYIHYYSLADGTGWIPDFDVRHPHKRSLHDRSGFSLAKVRRIAEECHMKEVALDTNNLLISYLSPDHAKVNVYYTTGTVATIVEHPRQGRAQFFRRHQNYDQLREIFINPRIHEEIGYTFPKRTSPNAPVAHRPPRGEPVEEDLGEEEVVRRQIARLDMEMIKMQLEKKRLLAAVELFDKHRLSEERRAKDRKLRAEQQQQMQHKGEKYYLRGEQMLCVTLNNNAFLRKHWEPSVKCIAFGNNTEIFLYDDGAFICSKPEFLPHALFCSLNDRTLHRNPTPGYLALGSKDRYFARFGASECEWSGSPDFQETVLSSEGRGKDIKSVSFGAKEDSWIILFENGILVWNNIPPRMEAFLRRPMNPTTAATPEDASPSNTCMAVTGAESVMVGTSSSGNTSITPIKIPTPAVLSPSLTERATPKAVTKSNRNRTPTSSSPVKHAMHMSPTDALNRLLEDERVKKEGKLAQQAAQQAATAALASPRGTKASTLRAGTTTSTTTPTSSASAGVSASVSSPLSNNHRSSSGGSSSSSSSSSSGSSSGSNAFSIAEVSLGPRGEWFAARVDEGEVAWEGNSTKFNSIAKSIKSRITHIVFGSDDSFLIRHR